MDDDNTLPTDLAECQRLLLAAFQRAAELSRVLDETAASYEELQTTHQAALEELSALKRWIYGRRTEKIVEGAGQRHLFDLESSSPSNLHPLIDALALITGIVFWVNVLYDPRSDAVELRHRLALKQFDAIRFGQCLLPWDSAVRSA